MNDFDEIRQRIAQMKGQPAPEYIYDITGLGHKAIEARAQRRWHEWNEGDTPLPYNDEIPY